MKIYLCGLIVGGCEFSEMPSRAFTSLQAAQDSFGEGLAWTTTAFGTWEHNPGYYPHPVVLEINLTA